MKRLYRSRTDRMLFGVAGGLAKYFEVDVVLVRLLWVLLLMSGVGVVGYIVAAIIMPEEPKVVSPKIIAPTGEQPKEEAGEGVPAEEPDKDQQAKAAGKQNLMGYILILLGVYFLLRQLVPGIWGHMWWLRADRLWPVIIVIAGLALIYRSVSK